MEDTEEQSMVPADKKFGGEDTHTYNGNTN